MQINEKVNGEKMSADQEKLIQQQMAAQEELERKQLEEARKMNRNIENEFEDEHQKINGHVSEQKKLVCLSIKSIIGVALGKKYLVLPVAQQLVLLAKQCIGLYSTKK